MLLPYAAGRLVHDTDGAAIPDKLHPSDRVPCSTGGAGYGGGTMSTINLP